MRPMVRGAEGERKKQVLAVRQRFEFGADSWMMTKFEGAEGDNKGQVLAATPLRSLSPPYTGAQMVRERGRCWQVDDAG